ncbi:MAG: diaminopimelate epimerase [Phycisphaerales bacterium]
MRFVKMHGIGNDYVYLDAVTDDAPERRPDLPALARAMSDRHRGIGSDGLILVCRPKGSAHVRMRMFNADGSESEMCGNGVRCVTKFAYDRLGVRANPMLVETGRGVLSIRYETAGGRLASATVDMGEPILDLSRIPVREDRLAWKGVKNHYGLTAGEAGDDAWVGVFVSMGNPHAVFFDDENARIKLEGLDRLDLPRIGPPIEHHPAFPNRVNAHFVVPRTPREAHMRTWERGAGATLACGTGACAVCVAGVRTGRLERNVLLHLPGGDLSIRWDEPTNHVFMTGPAADVFDGEWPA